MVRYEFMATTTVSSKGQIVIPRALREKYGLTTGTRLEVAESDAGLVLAPLERSRSSRRRAGWRTLRGAAKGTNALEAHLAEHRREAKR
jgi:AbrB family looped-hinge helix DNA binding protein